MRAHIHARTSRWNKTLFDPHVDVLRGTTEAISAALGGADSITVAPFDECYKRPDEDSRRLARNTQILIKQEAFLSRVADPGAGSYALEVLTDTIACESWKVTASIEAGGGYQKALDEGVIARTLKASLAAREKAIVSRRRVFAGTNQYSNASEKALERIDTARFDEHRGPWSYEELRLRTERHSLRTGTTPRVLLAECGDARMRSARSGFAAGFFACAGFDLLTRRFDNGEQIASQEADLIVLCSSDPEYPDPAAAVLAAQKARGSMSRSWLQATRKRPRNCGPERDISLVKSGHVMPVDAST